MNEAIAPAEIKRGPGRPPKNEAPFKKGNSTWQPANVLDIFNKESGYTYRIVEKSPRNVAKKQREGWEIVSGANSPNTGNHTGNYLDKGSQMTSVVEGYDYVVMRIPDELAQERTAYYNAESGRRMSALKRQTDQDLSKIGNGAPVHGSITIEKKGVRTIIKD